MIEIVKVRRPTETMATSDTNDDTNEGDDTMLKYRDYNRSYLDRWNTQMCRPTTKPLVDGVAIAVLKKQGFRDLTWEPRNLYDPASLYEMLDLYSPEHSHFVDFQLPEVKAGLGMMFKAFAKPKGLPKLKAVRLDGEMSEVYKALSIKGNKSAGLTAYGMKKLEAFPIAMRKVGEILRDKKAPDPCLAGCRTQAGKLGRLVWGYPLSMTIIEGCLARPLLSVFTKVNCTPMAFGQASAQIGAKMRRATSHTRHYVSMDASKFDTTIQSGVIKAGFNALKTWFDLKQEVGYGCTVADIFAIIEEYFINTPIVMPHPDGPRLYTGKRHGVPSGSYFTQIIDSVANIMMIGTLDFKYHLGLRLSEILILGDDMLFFTNKTPNLDKYAKTLSELYHMRMNVKKSVTGRSHEEIHFLGREWLNGLPYRDSENMISRAVAPESFRYYGDDKWRGASAVVASYG